MIKILFLIHDLGQGGAEKVLVNLVNNMDKEKFDITVTALFGGGVNEQFLDSRVKYNYIWKKAIPGNSKLMKLLSPKTLHKLCIKDEYDIEISYLEGPSARVISGCQNYNTKKICWIHSNHFSMDEVSKSFRNVTETKNCYSCFDKIICVSKYVKENFCKWMPVSDKCDVLYNTVESDYILEKSKEETLEIEDDNLFKLIAVGTLKEVKGYDRLLRIVKKLKEKRIDFKLYILGTGIQENELKQYVKDNYLEDTVVFLGYKTNPYKYVAKCDLFVCSSYSEGFSTAVTESLIVGTPVCTVDVSGMDEMLGDSVYGLIVDNDEDSLFEGLYYLINNRDRLLEYKMKARERGAYFDKDSTTKKAEKMMSSIVGNI